ncbi:MAG: hypothetical protein M3Y03_03265 [Verrucomicrobiota bacterium]|nr:hypothetical protein [Verrucomicrobiota bacterium]
MTRLFLCALLFWAGAVRESLGQGTAPATLSSPAETAATPAAKKKPARKTEGKTSPAVPNFIGNPTNGPITTEVYANEAYFDSKAYVGVFSGRVIVKDPRFNLQADKLTVHLGRGEVKGLETAVAEGNVGVVHEAPPEDGKEAVRSVGRAERAVYTAKDGNVELSGNPRVQSGLNTHVATSPDTVMILNQKGQLTTKGPSRTEIRQEPKPAPSAGVSKAPKP